MNNNKNTKSVNGFTLIELMITVAIVGILTAVALPAYQDYTIRSQVSEGLSLVSGAKPVVGEYFANHGEYPTNDKIGFTGYVGKYVSKTEIGTDGKIVATFGNQANTKITGQTVTLVPETDTNTGNIKWTCGSSANAKYLPTSCANDGSTGNPGNPGGGTDPTNPGEGGNTEPPFDFSKPANYYKGNFIYNGDGTITIDGEVLTGTLDDGSMSFGSTLYGDITIDKNGNLIAKNYYTNYETTSTYLKDDPDSKLLITSKFNINGTTYELDSLGMSGTLPDYLDTPEKQDMYRDVGSALNIFRASARNGTELPPDALNNYEQKRQQYIDLLKSIKSSGATLTKVDELFLDKYK